MSKNKYKIEIDPKLNSSLKQLKKSAKRILKKNYSDLSWQEILNDLENNELRASAKIYKFFHQKENHTILSRLKGNHCKLPYKMNLFRVTKWFNEHPNKRDIYKSQSAYYVPPKSNCEIQRANLAGIQIFYCSTNPHTAIDEMNLKTEELFFISVWKFNSLDQKFADYSYNLESEGLQSLSSYLFNKQLKEIESNYSTEKLKCIKYLNEFYSEVFRLNNDKYQKNDKYKISSALSHRDMFLENCAGIIYPSIKDPMRQNNIAIKKEIADSKVKLKWVLGCKYLNDESSKDANSKRYIIASLGIPFKEKVKWIKYNQKKHLKFVESILNIRFTSD